MPRIAVEDNSRMSLRIRPEDKALILRAVALNHTDLTDFVIRQAVLAAKAVIEAGGPCTTLRSRQSAGSESAGEPARPTGNCWRPLAPLPKRPKS